MDGKTFSERELKYTLATQAYADTLAAAEKLGSEFVLRGDVLVQHFDTYFDTDSYDLLRRGYSLRVRNAHGGEEGETRVTLKAFSPGNGALFERGEIEAQIDTLGEPPHLEAWPKSLESAVSELIANPDGLHPIAALRQERRRRLIYLKDVKDKDVKDKDVKDGDAQPQPVAELSIDNVRVLSDALQSLNGETPAVAGFDEVEVEQVGDAPTEHLETINKRLEKRRGFAAARASKLTRALEATGEMMPGSDSDSGGIRPETPMAEACRLIWRLELTHILLSEHGIRRAFDVEVVHAMRVAIRKARVAAKLFGLYFRKRAIEPHLRMLGKLGDRLGAVRDLDVALQEIARRGERHEASAENAMIGEEWRARRETKLRKLIALLDSDEYRRFVADFARFCATPVAGVKKIYRHDRLARMHTVQSIMPQLLLQQFARIRAYQRAVEAKKVSAETLHALRIECKTMRYSLEFCRGLLGSDGEKMIQKLKETQDALGAINDAVVEQERLNEWLSELREDDDAEKPDRKAMAARLKTLAQTEEKLSRDFPGRFAKLIDATTRRTLALAVAQL